MAAAAAAPEARLAAAVVAEAEAEPKNGCCSRIRLPWAEPETRIIVANRKSIIASISFFTAQLMSKLRISNLPYLVVAADERWKHPPLLEARPS